MSFIKEPDGVDFLIQSLPLTEKEKEEINDFIRARKSKKTLVKKNNSKKVKV